LRDSGGDSLEIYLVAQGMTALKAVEEAAKLANRTFYLYDAIGFAAANNHAFKAAKTEFIATVNDDVVVEKNWYPALVEALDVSPEIAAVQGVNLRLGEKETLDGCGIAWNRAWQALQIGFGEPHTIAPRKPVEIFGVSATAALYRRQVLAKVDLAPAGQSPIVFDENLYSYYEDVDLACRLRGAGYRAQLVPGARAEHAGSASSRELSLGAHQLIYGNRYLVLARFLGREFRRQFPRIWLRDMVDLGGALRRTDPGLAMAIFGGWARAALRLRRYVHSGAPVMPLEGVKRFFATG
jgi:GT2 family glycosyltransferase